MSPTKKDDVFDYNGVLDTNQTLQQNWLDVYQFFSTVAICRPHKYVSKI